MTDQFDDLDMAAARAKFSAKVNGGKSARKLRQKRVSDSVDRRSLRETGRTEQFNFKSIPGLKARAKVAATRKGVRLAEWMEQLVEAALAAEASGDDAESGRGVR